MAPFQDNYTIKLHDTDAAGILFFANQFRIIHDLYESFLGEIGFAFRDCLDRREFFIPIIHARSDFKIPLMVGDVVTITLNIVNIGQTSFKISYRLVDQSGNLAGTAETVHVTIDPTSKAKIDLPDRLRRQLDKWVTGDS